MKDHPLFNEDPNDVERRSRNIDFINVYQTVNGKKQVIANQWDADQLQTIADLYDALGEGNFELVGREDKRKQVVDRVVINVRKARPGGPEAPPKPDATQPAIGPPVSTTPLMQLGGMQIPQGVDSNMAIMLAMMHTTQQQMASQLAAQRADANAYMQSQQQLMVGLSQSNSQLLVGLIQGIGSLVHQSTPGAPDRSAEAFIKGIETMTELQAGIKEGAGAATPTDWATVSANIVNGIRQLKDLSAMSSNVVPVGAAPPVAG